MFFQPPDDELNQEKTLQSNTKRRRQKKLKRKNKLRAVKKDFARRKNARNPVPITMSSWAENYTKAATWQLKHQVAYWKSKATALEYENKFLHDIIRKNYLSGAGSCSVDTEVQMSHDEDTVDSENENEVEEDDDGDLEVSEEYIQFLMDNKKYRDDAKRERERLKAQNDSEQKIIEAMEAGPAENTIDPQEVLKKLYGDNWEKISALETSMRSDFINFCDQEKPMHWPNIPFNFNFG